MGGAKSWCAKPKPPLRRIEERGEGQTKQKPDGAIGRSYHVLIENLKVDLLHGGKFPPEKRV